MSRHSKLRNALAVGLLTASSCDGGPTSLNSREVVWRFPLSSLFFGDPSFDDRRIFLVDRDRLIAIDRITGEEAWDFQSPNGPIGTEGIPVSNGKVFLYTDQFVYAFATESGEQLWRSQLDRFWSGAFLGGAVTAGDQLVYAVAHGGAVYALDGSTGRVVWYTEISPQPTKGIESSGLFCIGSNAQDEEIPAGALTCLSLDSGAIVWRKNIQVACTGGGVPGRPIVSGGSIIVGDQCGQLLAFDLMTGAKIWEKKYDTAFDADLVVNNGVGYACLRTSSCIAFSLDTGEILWQSPILASVLEAPTVEFGIVWVTDLSGSLFVLDASGGGQVVRLDPPDDGATFFSRPIVDRETVYTGGGSFFYALARP